MPTHQKVAGEPRAERMRIHGVLARLMTMVTALALALAPAIIVATHGPATLGSTTLDPATLAEAAQTKAHGHAHDDDGIPWQGHDATDHDHQHTAVLTGRTHGHDAPARFLHVLNARAAYGRTEDRPRRPPRI